jgi:cytoskeletal protein RodZ
LSLEAPPEIPAPMISEALPDSIIAATTPSVAIAPAVTGAPEPTYDRQRENTRRNQMLMALALLFVVVVLAGVLIWVLRRSATQVPPAEPAVEKTTNLLFSPTHYFKQSRV